MKQGGYMRHILEIFAAFLLMIVLSGCWGQKVEPEEEKPQQPIQIACLRVEIPRGTLDADRLNKAMETLPNQLQKAFAEHTDYRLNKVELTVGASYAATMEAMAAGNVDLAFIPADTYVKYADVGEALLAGISESDYAATHALFCAAPTEYGAKLDERAASGKPFSWLELSQARWGVLDKNSMGGYRCLDLWLSDNYDGKRVSDLESVNTYASYEELLRAAAAGKVDLLTIRQDVREDAEKAWILSDDRTAEGGFRGFGRTEPIWDELPVLDISDALYGTLVISKSSLAEQKDFKTALGIVLNTLETEQPEQMLLLESSGFEPICKEELEPQRRLYMLENGQQ